MIGGGKSAYLQIFVHCDPRALGEREGLALVVSEQFFGPPPTW
jgi:hypothetical protein